MFRASEPVAIPIVPINGERKKKREEKNIM